MSILQDGIFCLIEEFTRGLMDVVQEVSLADSQKYADMSIEEYNLIRPTKMEKSAMMVDMFKTFLETKGKCGNCTEWQMEAAEMKTSVDAER